MDNYLLKIQGMIDEAKTKAYKDGFKDGYEKAVADIELNDFCADCEDDDEDAEEVELDVETLEVIIDVLKAILSDIK